jgi:hypothetical protein
MPEMPAIARALATSSPYLLIARRVLLPWVLQGETGSLPGTTASRLRRAGHDRLLPDRRAPGARAVRPARAAQAAKILGHAMHETPFSLPSVHRPATVKG